jgi:RES domain-containing protein
MIVFRISLVRYADALYASGNPARWNSKNVRVVYTAGSRALACLENVVHRTSRGLQEKFRTLVIDIPDSLKVMIVDKKTLPANWQQYNMMIHTQKSGNAWVKDQSSAVLRVPSVIIPEEYNFVLNPAHKDFHKIKLIASEPFEFDGRLKGT